jgi:mannose-6-phosphate isomerase-like protein (cupin superfamily)
MQEIETDVTLVGATMRFAETRPERFVAELTAAPGFSPTPHVHRTHEELFYVLEGEFAFLLGDDVMHLTEGAFVAVPPGTVHDFRNIGTRDGRLLGICTPGGLDDYFRSVAAHVAEATLTMSVLDELRMRYDTDPVRLVWSV